MNNQKLSILHKRDLLELMEIASNSLFCKDVAALRSLFSQLSRLMNFNSVCCAYGDIRKAVDQEIPDVDLLDISYPENYLEHYLGNHYHKTDPVIVEYIQTFEPVNWNSCLNIESNNIRYIELVDAEAYGMKDGWTHGVVTPDTGETSIFFLAGEEKDNSDRTKTIIEYIIPFLSEAYKKILKNSRPALSEGTPVLTLSEIEILNWLKAGKTSWEISIILNKSERVINFHINNAVKKLNAMNRTHAVVMALKNNLISL